MSAATSDDRIHALLDGGVCIYIARQSGLFRLSPTDGPATNMYESWQPGQAIATLATAKTDAGALLAGINGGITRSDDGGQSWDAQQFRVPPPLITCIGLSPALGDDGVVLAGSFEDGISRSDDGGHRFVAHNFGLFDHNVYCVALSPAFADDGIAFAGTGSGVYRSDNGGRYWRDMPMPAGDETVLSLALSPDFADNGRLFAGTDAHGILRSDDRGESWSQPGDVNGAVNALLILPGDASRMVALVNDAVQLSDDGGASRRLLQANATQAVALSRDGSAVLLGMADGAVKRLPL